MAFVAVAKLDDLWSGEMKGVVAGGTRVLLVNLEGKVLAYEDRCAHQGARLSEGRLRGGVLTCAAHGWQFDARTGRGVNPGGVAIERFAVEIEEGMVLVDLGERSDAPAQQAGSGGSRDPELEVGPVLEAGPTADAVVAAIRELDERAVALDRGAYVRVVVPERCAFTRRAVERHLGGGFRLPGDLEKIMPSFKGRLVLSEEAAEWTRGPRR